MREFVKLNRQGMSILIVTHDGKVASCCERVLYMADGKIAGEIMLGKFDESQQQKREKKLSEWLEKQGW